MQWIGTGTTMLPSSVRRQSTRTAKPILYTVAVFLILLPQPSLLLVAVEYYLRATHRPLLFILCITPPFLLTFLAFSSLIVTTVRDPGSPKDADESSRPLSDEPFHPRFWCTKCQAPKPERTHHCSFCKRCVLKMDHHCPWLANKCIVGVLLPLPLSHLIDKISGFTHLSCFHPLPCYRYPAFRLYIGDLHILSLLLYIQSL
jgi:hypothetical protein